MYLGNGITRKFPLPDGYDGSVVFLKIAGSKGVRMTQGDGYEVKDNTVIFYAPVPAGVEIIFDYMNESEVLNPMSKSYIIIYADGTMTEVDEDPTLILEEAKKLLIEAKRCALEITDAYNGAQAYVSQIINASTADFDGRLDGYSQTIDDAVSEAALSTKTAITDEWAVTLERMTAESKAVREDLSALQKLKRELQSIYDTAIESFKNSMSEHVAEALESCEEVRKLKPELALYSLEIQKELKQIVINYEDEIRTKINEELDLLRNLREKMEEDYNTLNIKINNRWDILRGEING